MVVTTILNGLSQGMLLFLIASGLSLIFGVMGVVNFAHGSIYALGAFVGVSVYEVTGSFWAALLVSPIVVGVIGIAIERVTLRPLYSEDPIFQVLLTFGVLILIEEGIRLVWGSSTRNLPAGISGTIDLGFVTYPTYRIFIILFGLLVFVGLWLFIHYTRVGIIIRAGTTDREMVEMLGVDIGRINTLTFAVGAGLAAVAGVIAAPLLSVSPSMGVDILIEAFVVVVVGGIGSVVGPFVGAVLLGLAWSFIGVYLGGFVGFVMFAAMAVILLLKPEGLFRTRGLLEESA